MYRLEEDMFFPNDYFKNEDIYVWYNKEDYPIPANANAKEIIRKTSHYIISALRQLGSVGRIDFLAIYHDDPAMKNVLLDAGIYPMKPTGYKQGERNMFETMIGSLVSFSGIEPPDYEDDHDRTMMFDKQPPPTYVVIAKPDFLLDRTLKCLEERNVQIVLLHPPGGDYMFSSVLEVLEHGELLGGEKLIDISQLPEVPGEMDIDYKDHPGLRFHCSFTDIMERIVRSEK